RSSTSDAVHYSCGKCRRSLTTRCNWASTSRSSSRCSSTAASNFWTAGPLALVNVFDAGRRRAVKEQALASYDHAAASYRESVLAAFREVEDQLSTLHVLDEEAAIQANAVARVGAIADARQQSLSRRRDQLSRG